MKVNTTSHCFLGNIDGNESVFDTAIRETKEETGLDVCTDYEVHIQYKVYFEVRFQDCLPHYDVI